MSDAYYDKEDLDKKRAMRSYKPVNALNFTNPSSIQFQNIARAVKLMDALFAVASSPSAVNDAVKQRRALLDLVCDGHGPPHDSGHLDV